MPRPLIWPFRFIYIDKNSPWQYKLQRLFWNEREWNFYDRNVFSAKPDFIFRLYLNWFVYDRLYDLSGSVGVKGNFNFSFSYFCLQWWINEKAKLTQMLTKLNVNLSFNIERLNKIAFSLWFESHFSVHQLLLCAHVTPTSF